MLTPSYAWVLEGSLAPQGGTTGTLANKYTAYLEKYKKQMVDLEKSFDELRAAVDKGDETAIQTAFEKLSDMKEKGHKDFAPDE